MTYGLDITCLHMHSVICNGRCSEHVNVQGYPLGQEEVGKLSAIPKMLALLNSTSETVKERAAQALLVSPEHACINALLCAHASCLHPNTRCTSRVAQHLRVRSV